MSSENNGYNPVDEELIHKCIEQEKEKGAVLFVNGTQNFDLCMEDGMQSSIILSEEDDDNNNNINIGKIIEDNHLYKKDFKKFNNPNKWS